MDWSPTDWACAVAGECGEVCNEIKKLRRGKDVPMDVIGDELADTIIYADLLAARLGIDLSEAIVRKFNAVSKKRNLPVFLNLE
jgi:NTP pyrophosphatase (non-canonical NTP hydrolase)